MIMDRCGKGVMGSPVARHPIMHNETTLLPPQDTPQPSQSRSEGTHDSITLPSHRLWRGESTGGLSGLIHTHTHTHTLHTRMELVTLMMYGWWR